ARSAPACVPVPCRAPSAPVAAALAWVRLLRPFSCQVLLSSITQLLDFTSLVLCHTSCRRVPSGRPAFHVPHAPDRRCRTPASHLKLRCGFPVRQFRP